MDFPTTPDAYADGIEVTLTTTGDEYYTQFKFRLPDQLAYWVPPEDVANLFLAFVAEVRDLVLTNAPVGVTGINASVSYIGTANAPATIP
jgi:hypothetical protein